MKIALLGFGAVGQGFFSIIQELPELQVEVLGIAVRYPDKPRNVQTNIPFTTNARELIEHPEVEAVVEAISDAQAAADYALHALELGKPVVSASKKMLASRLPDLQKAVAASGQALRYEAAAAAAIPVLHNLNDALAREPLLGIRGILNGSTNYMLTQIAETGVDYASILKQAQAKGFAEEDPTLDVDGWDAMYKTILLGYQGYGRYIPPQQVPFWGISRLGELENQLASEYGGLIRLVSRIDLRQNGLELSVLPELLLPTDPLYSIRNEQNAVEVHAAFSGTHLWAGAGAGGRPTGSALVLDLCQLPEPYAPSQRLQTPEPAPSAPIRLYVRSAHSLELRRYGQVLDAQQSGYLVQLTYSQLHPLLQALWQDPKGSVVRLPDGGR